MQIIPKKIHYCWFGGKPLPDSAKKYIETWKHYCPDYEIVEWNESNFNISINPYVKEAYAAGKWAFITDYVRLFVLYTYGGIYMDTDVEVIKNIDIFLQHPAFSGFESSNYIPTGIIGATKNNRWIEYLLSYYNDRHFRNSDNSLDLTSNVVTITKMTKEKYGITLDNTFQSIEGLFALYPFEYFCPKDYKTGIINTTSNTYAIHHFAGSWCDPESMKCKSEKNEIISSHQWLLKLDKTVLGHKILATVIPAWTIYRVYGLKTLIKDCHNRVIKKK